MILELRVVLRHLGLLLLVLSALIFLVGAFGSVEFMLGEEREYGEPAACLLASLGGVIAGGVLYFSGKKGAELLGQREALLLVTLSWIFGAALAAVPYFLWAQLRSDAADVPHDFDSYVSCYFESMSGLTTTGATIVQSLETVPRALLLWRALTHWLGGLGIVVLFVAVLPMLGVGSRRVFRVESPGPQPEGVMPRIQDTARALWMIYVGLTIVEIIALLFCGMTFFDAVCHTFATLATGGFSTVDSSIAGFTSSAIHLVIILFMFLAGVNFGLYYQIIRGQWRTALRDPELRAYIVIILAATTIVTFSLTNTDRVAAGDIDAPASFAINLRDALFQVVGVQTTTGFCSANFDTWAFPAKATLLVLMFIGASAGSTGGGIKIIRILIAGKVIVSELEHVYRPKVVRSVKIGKTPIDAELRLNTLVYVLGILMLFAAGTVVLMALEAHQDIDITTAATASAATLNNIGPGLARVGATQNYAWFSPASKAIMSLLMVVGRLEMYAIIVLLTPRFWQGR